MKPLRDREEYEAEEDARLAPFAVRSRDSSGRVVAEPEHPYRTAFQRDRDRIIHSRGFRRLEYKTQVFVHHEGDHYRNRLTHTLEASQIARTVARALRLNEDLAEAIVLAHDLGHTPFGHAGEHVLDDLMRDHGGFDHNRQSLRVVDLLEERYPGFRGLNLSQETRAGICKHGHDWEHPVPLPPLGAHPCLEAQVADSADEMAYVHHDLDDGLRSGLLSPDQLAAVDLWREARERACAGLADAPERVRRAQTLVALIDHLVTDFILETGRRAERLGVRHADDVRRARSRVGGFSPEAGRARTALKRFLHHNLYQHPGVVERTRAAERILSELFHAYLADAAKLPEHVVARFEADGEARAVADYVAGMTDRFAEAERRRLAA